MLKSDKLVPLFVVLMQNVKMLKLLIALCELKLGNYGVGKIGKIFIRNMLIELCICVIMVLLAEVFQILCQIYMSLSDERSIFMVKINSGLIKVLLTSLIQILTVITNNLAE